MDGCTFHNNSAAGSGGAVYGTLEKGFLQVPVLGIRNSVFSSNSAKNGGSVVINGGNGGVVL